MGSWPRYYAVTRNQEILTISLDSSNGCEEIMKQNQETQTTSSNDCEEIVEQNQEIQTTMTNSCKEIVKRNQEILKMPSNSSNDCEEIVKQNQEIQIISANSSNTCEEILKPNQEIQATSSNSCKEIVKRNPQISIKLPVSQMAIISSPKDRKRRIRKKWNEDELNALEAGMEEYGTSWSRIYEKYGNAHGVLRNRSQVQLKDKARNEKLRRKRCGVEIGVFELATGD
ncbi:myb DNA binding protein [Gigaspora margarita]|uniref:Myb DNA binding protein n=1 Tax=Gigaspora margarita TaxID=4874 RepID=A0A8H4A4K3_GIGMA|nr:myb DNA binding protein [Gigaspora margarita]